MNENVIGLQKKNRRNEEVLEAALEVFAEEGFRKASVEEISGRLGLTPGALYRYAEDKRDLYRKAVAQAFVRWQDAVAQAVSQEVDPLVRFRLACTTAYRYLAKDDKLRKVLARDPSLFPFFESEDLFKEINRGSEALIEGIIADGTAQGVFSARGVEDIRSVGRIIFSLYILFVQKTYVAGESDEGALFERSLDLILDGLRTR